MTVEIIWSALKHGCTRADIARALSSAVQRLQIDEGPAKWLYVGFDRSARPLEIVTVQGDDGIEVVVHAMKSRKRHYPEGGCS